MTTSKGNTQRMSAKELMSVELAGFVVALAAVDGFELATLNGNGGFREELQLQVVLSDNSKTLATWRKQDGFQALNE